MIKSGSSILNENKIKTYLGFAIRSGKVVFGYDNLMVTRKNPLLVLISQSQGDKVADKVMKYCMEGKIRCIRLPFNLEDLLDRNCKVIAVLDKSLSDAIYNELKVEN